MIQFGRNIPIGGFMLEEVKNICLELLKEYVHEKTFETTDETRLYGKDGLLTSILLVRYLSDLEDEVNEKYNTTISLMNEKAFSKSSSPFRDISSLSEFIVAELKNPIEEEGD